MLGLDKDFFLNHFKKVLKSEFSPISYDLIYKSAKIEKQAYVFILTVASVQMVLSGKDAFTSALKNSLVSCLKIKDE